MSAATRGGPLGRFKELGEEDALTVLQRGGVRRYNGGVGNEVNKMAQVRVDIPQAALAAFCRKWRIVEFAVFGSALRDDFDAASDVDVVVSFEPAAAWSLADLVAMAAELEDAFGRPVDLVEKEALRNPFRRHEILTTREVLYAA